MRFSFAVTVSFLLQASAAVLMAQDQPPEAGVVASVNGELLHFEDLERQLGSLHSGQAEVRRSAFDIDKLIERVVNDALLAQEARGLGMHEEDPIPQRLQELREEMALQRLEDEEIWRQVEITEAEIRQTFNDSYQKVTFRLFTTEDRSEAEELRRQLDEGADLATLAEDFAAPAEGRRYQLFEAVARIDLPPDIESAVFGIEPGEITGPFSTRLGWSIAQLESRRAPAEEDFPSAETRIREEARFREADALRKELSKRLRESIEVSVNEETADVGCERDEEGNLIPRVERPDAIVATVGKRTLTAGEFGEVLRMRWEVMFSPEAALASRQIVLERLLDHELMVAEALRRGFGETPEVERAVQSYLTELLVPRFLSEVLAPSIDVTPEEKEAYYRDYREEFRRLPRIKLGQVTVSSQEEAERVAQLLRQNADLSWVAEKYSIDKFKNKGGNRGWIVPDMSLGDFQRTLIEAEPGAILGPFPQNESRFVIYRVDAIEDQGYYTLNEVSGNVRQVVFAQKFRGRLDEILARLRADSEIEIYQEALDRMEISGQAAAESPH